MAVDIRVNQKAQLLTMALGREIVEERPTLYKKARMGEDIIRAFLFFCGFVSIFTTIGILIVLGNESLQFFTSGAVTLPEFFTSTNWQPYIDDFGILTLVVPTLVVSGIAMLVAVPLGLGAAIFLSEYAKPRIRATVKPILELLAGIPTVVYGFFALTFVAPIFQNIVGQQTMPQLQSMVSAAVVMGFMIVPTIASMSEDALSAVPRSLREASYGLGANRLETTIKVVLPAAVSGIVAAFILGISRAIGETMIVAVAAGAVSKLTFNPFEAAETMTGHIVRISGGELPHGGVDYNSLFAIGLTLFVITLILNLISRAITERLREVY
jgi:phosphate transport system permease protein